MTVLNDQGDWHTLLQREWAPVLAVLLGGVLLHSMSVLLLATVLPSIVQDIGGAALMSWSFTAYLATSIMAASCTGSLTSIVGSRGTYLIGALTFLAGTLLCASAPSMHQIILGRLIQGFGGGLLSAAAYVLVRSRFPEPLWPRVFALLAGVWGISVLIGPLVGGLFANSGHWRGAFITVAALACGLTLVTLLVLPPTRREQRGPQRRVPWMRMALLCIGIGALSAAAAAGEPARIVGLVVATFGALGLMLWLDRRSAIPLLPRDAFSLRSGTGIGLWIALLVSIAFNPLQTYVPLFLQTLHGFDPLSAGYTIATASMAWTVSALAVAGLSDPWSDRLIIIGPLMMGTGLILLAFLLPAGPVAGLFPGIMLLGGGIGSCWAFIAQRIMSGAKAGDEDVAASSVATVQQAGLALGAAAAGLIANGFGLSSGTNLDPNALARAAFWIPAAFVAVAGLGALMGIRLRRRSRSLT